jgi:hypothetical protein
MTEILIACGDIELLKKIIGALPDDAYKPIATKKGAGIAAKIASRQLPYAIVHEQLEDIPGAQLLHELEQHSPETCSLYLCASAPPDDGPFTAAQRYPVPDPVLRNALRRVVEADQDEHDIEQWRLFYRELKHLLGKQPEQNYYRILGLEEGAPHHAVVSAFDRLSLRYHPDRYNQFVGEKWGAAIHEKTSQLYRVITEAYSVLTDRRMRKRYDRALADGQLRLDPEEISVARDGAPESIVDLATNARSKKFLKLAQSDLASKNYPGALQNLQFAMSMESNNQALADKIAELEAMMEEG